MRFKIPLFLSLFCILLIFSGCATVPQHQRPVSIPTTVTYPSSQGFYYTVQRGDTLWRISRNYGLSVDKLASVNRLSDAGAIEVGQRLFIPKPEAAGSVSRPSPIKGEDFAWPVRGRIISYFGSKDGEISSKGILIAVPQGSVVKATRSGKVVYCDDFFKGLGKTVIIDHGDDFSSVYAHNSKILVNVGDYVNQMQPIAEAGSTGRTSVSALHFEIRKGHKAQNPLFYLKSS